MSYPDQLISFLYGSSILVPVGIWTTIASKESVETDTHISLIVCSGSVYAEFAVHVGGKVVALKRSGPNRNVDFYFPVPLYLITKSSIDVKVKHYRADETPSFDCGVFSVNYF